MGKWTNLFTKAHTIYEEEMPFSYRLQQDDNSEHSSGLVKISYYTPRNMKNSAVEKCTKFTLFFPYQFS